MVVITTQPGLNALKCDVNAVAGLALKMRPAESRKEPATSNQ
jgi:hypothetical protein